MPSRLEAIPTSTEVLFHPTPPMITGAESRTDSQYSLSSVIITRASAPPASPGIREENVLEPHRLDAPCEINELVKVYGLLQVAVSMQLVAPPDVVNV